MLPAQEPGGKRTPYRRSQPDLSIQRQILILHAFAVEHVVLGLFHLRRSKTIFPGKPVRSHNVRSAPLRSSPVEYPSLMNQIVHSTNSLLDRSARVRAMTEEQI